MYVCALFWHSWKDVFCRTRIFVIENAFDKKTNNDFDINGIPEENDSMK